MNDRFSALRLFVRVARTRSFSRAGRESGVSQPSVSRLMAELERDVGATLLARTTRAVTLTEAGAAYLARIEPILAALDAADHAARGGADLRGMLRIAVSSSFGIREVIPRLPPFLDRHPALKVTLSFSDARLDLVSEGIDVALRIGPLPDSSAIARLLGRAPRIVVAAPAYLDRAGMPSEPSDLAAHAVVIGPVGPSQQVWSFASSRGTRASVKVDGRVTASTNDGATAAAVAGLGVAVMSAWGCRAELADGRLVRLMADWTMDEVEAHAVFPGGGPGAVRGGGPGPAARAFVDHLAAALRDGVG